jgi:hypothetical protein
MKLPFIFLAGMLAMVCSSVAEDATNQIAFTHAPVSEVLSFYERISGLKLVIDSHVKTCGYWMTGESSPEENKVLMKIIEKTLETQAGIVITKLDDNKRASVTINDALRLGGLIEDHVIMDVDLNPHVK